MAIPVKIAAATGKWCFLPVVEVVSCRSATAIESLTADIVAVAVSDLRFMLIVALRALTADMFLFSSGAVNRTESNVMSIDSSDVSYRDFNVRIFSMALISVSLMTVCFCDRHDVARADVSIIIIATMSVLYSLVALKHGHAFRAKSRWECTVAPG